MQYISGQNFNRTENSRKNGEKVSISSKKYIRATCGSGHCLALESSLGNIQRFSLCWPDKMVVLIIACVYGREPQHADAFCFCVIPKPRYSRAKKSIHKHDKHWLLSEGWKEKWFETPLKPVVINYTEGFLDQTWAREERSIGLFYLLLFCLPLSGPAVFLASLLMVTVISLL